MRSAVTRMACLGMMMAVFACGDDGDDNEGSRQSAGIEGGNISSGGECTAGMVMSPATDCPCPDGVARRFCTEDGVWGDCECVERSECLDVVDFICPNDCPGDPAPRSVGPCIDDEPPNCRCPDGSAGTQPGAGSDEDDAGTDEDAGT